MAKKIARPRPEAEPRPEAVEFVKKVANGTVSHEDFLKLSPEACIIKGIKKTFSEIRAAAEYIGPPFFI